MCRDAYKETEIEKHTKRQREIARERCAETLIKRRR